MASMYAKNTPRASIVVSLLPKDAQRTRHILPLSNGEHENDIVVQFFYGDSVPNRHTDDIRDDTSFNQQSSLPFGAVDSSRHWPQVGSKGGETRKDHRRIA